MDVVGYIWAQVHERADGMAVTAQRMLHIEHIGVRPSFQRRGCGNALIAEVKALARRMGISTLTLSVWSFNTKAQQFFEQLGFTPYMLYLRNDLTASEAHTD